MQQRAFDQLDQLDIILGLLLCEARFTISLTETETPQMLEIDSQDFAAILRQFARQLETAQGMARQLLEAMGKR